MTTQEDTETVVLLLTVRQSITILPRCLQILSRRGFILLQLTTEEAGDGQAVLKCTVRGPVRWHEPLVRLLERLVDVQQVAVTISEPPHA